MSISEDVKQGMATAMIARMTNANDPFGQGVTESLAVSNGHEKVSLLDSIYAAVNRLSEANIAQAGAIDELETEKANNPKLSIVKAKTERESAIDTNKQFMAAYLAILPAAPRK